MPQSVNPKNSGFAEVIQLVYLVSRLCPHKAVRFSSTGLGNPTQLTMSLIERCSIRKWVRHSGIIESLRRVGRASQVQVRHASLMPKVSCCSSPKVSSNPSRLNSRYWLVKGKSLYGGSHASINSESPIMRRQSPKVKCHPYLP